MFIACNYYSCTEEYLPRMEKLLVDRTHIIDTQPGFMGLKTLKPLRTLDHYLVVSKWADQSQFEAWRYSEEFMRLHEKAYGDLKRYEEQGMACPIKSTFRTYQLIGI